MTRTPDHPQGVSVVIPTFERDAELLDTIRLVSSASPPPEEILVVDQTPRHPPATEAALSGFEEAGVIRWLRLSRASIPHAMNVGLERARFPIVLFLDDDVIPDPGLVGVHKEIHAAGRSEVVAGQVLQPGEVPEGTSERVRFNSAEARWIVDLMACNFSIRRRLALDVGGFDENFVRAAYRFETEFAERLASAGRKILFEPRATIRHLQVAKGGTRSYGDHLRTGRPGHSVGAYYYLLRSTTPGSRVGRILSRYLRSARTRHHLRRPWWIVPTLVAETVGLAWACMLALQGPRLLDPAIAEESRDS